MNGVAEVTAGIVSSWRIRHLQAITAPLLSMCLLMLTAKTLSSERLCVVSGMNASHCAADKLHQSADYDFPVEIAHREMIK